jgi:hypothetical protein
MIKPIHDLLQAQMDGPFRTLMGTYPAADAARGVHPGNLFKSNGPNRTGVLTNAAAQAFLCINDRRMKWDSFGLFHSPDVPVQSVEAYRERSGPGLEQGQRLLDTCGISPALREFIALAHS